MPDRPARLCGSEAFRPTSSMTVRPKAIDALTHGGDLICDSQQVYLMSFLLQPWIEHLLCSLTEDQKMDQRGSLFSRSSQSGGEG